MKYKKNDIVSIIDDEVVYFNYSQFIKRHPKYTIRWVYKEFPNTTHQFIVKGVYKHCQKDKYDTNERCVVVEDCITKQIYLIGENGLALQKDK